MKIIAGILDRYILRQFVMTVAFVLVALCSIFLIVNLIENLDNFMDDKFTFWMVVLYYRYYFPDIIRMVTPVAFLLASLFSIGKMSTSNEITAMKSGGMSLYRLIAGLGTFSLLLSVGQLYFNGWIVPESNTMRLEMDRKLLHSDKTGGPVNDLYFRETPLRNISIKYYDSDNKVGNGISIEDYTSEMSPRLVKRLEANKIAWDSTGSQWLLSGVIERTYQGTHIITARRESQAIKMKLDHKQIMNIKRSTDELNFDEVREYIEVQRAGGKDVRKRMIEYYSNFAFPFANVIVILFAVPFSSVRRRGGVAIQIAAAMIISFVYLVFTKVSQTIGYSTELNPEWVGWSANILFAGFGLYVLWKTPK